MVRSPFRRAIVCRVLTVVLCASSGLRAAAPSPEEVLKTHGLKLVGSLYVLELETAIHEKATEIRQLARKLKWSQAQQRATGSLEEYQKSIKGLNDQIRGYQSEIQAANQRMNRFPRYRRGTFFNNFAAESYSEILAYRNQLQMELSQATAILNQLKSQPFNTQSKQKIDALVRDDQESYDQALRDFRKLVNSASEKYTELHKDSSIDKALHSLGRNAKVKPKLGPSPQYVTNVKLLEKLEKEKASAGSGGPFEDAPRAARRSSRTRRSHSAATTKSPESGKSD